MSVDIVQIKQAHPRASRPSWGKEGWPDPGRHPCHPQLDKNNSTDDDKKVQITSRYPARSYLFHHKSGSPVFTRVTRWPTSPWGETAGLPHWECAHVKAVTGGVEGGGIAPPRKDTGDIDTSPWRRWGLSKPLLPQVKSHGQTTH